MVGFILQNMPAKIYLRCLLLYQNNEKSYIRQKDYSHARHRYSIVEVLEDSSEGRTAFSSLKTPKEALLTSQQVWVLTSLGLSFFWRSHWRYGTVGTM
jgi:hypothetical protein